MLESKYLSPLARGLTPYVPGEQPRDQQYIKLNTNENPYPPSPRALAAIAGASGSLARYPDPECTAVRRAAAALHGLAIEQVFAGNGSDEVLALAFRALFNPALPILFPDVTYSFYPVFSAFNALQWQAVPLTPDWRIEPQDYDRPAGGMIIANPNAPTGGLLPLPQLERLADIARARGCALIVDEAYVDFGGESALPLIPRYDNVLVVRTLSKSHALAGLRVGYALGNPGLIDGLVRVKDSFNSYPLDSIAQAVAAAALADGEYTRQSCQRVAATRDRFAAALRQLGFDVPESRANFVFALPPAPLAAGQLMASLRARGVLVRHLSGPRTAPRLRISIGTDGEMDRVLEIIAEILRA